MSIIDRFIGYVKWLYLQYSLITALNILDKFERQIFNGVVLFVLSIFIYSTCVFLPRQLASISRAFYEFSN